MTQTWNRMFICQRQNMYKRYSYETLMIEFINNSEFVTPICWNYFDDCLLKVHFKTNKNIWQPNLLKHKYNCKIKPILIVQKPKQCIWGRRPRNCSQLITIKFTFIYINSLWLIGTRFIFKNKLVFFTSHTFIVGGSVMF